MIDPTVDEMLTDLVYEVDLETLRESTARFVRGLAEDKKRRGFLTPDQITALKKTYNEVFR